MTTIARRTLQREGQPLPSSAKQRKMKANGIPELPTGGSDPKLRLAKSDMEPPLPARSP